MGTQSRRLKIPLVLPFRSSEPLINRFRLRVPEDTSQLALVVEGPCCSFAPAFKGEAEYEAEQLARRRHCEPASPF
jgi:hypothetical protein